MTAAMCRLGLTVPATGANVIVDVEYGTSPASMSTIFNTLPSIVAGAYSGTGTDLAITSLAAGAWLKFNIDQKGSILPGENLTVEILE
jgi:hypothetical protein